MKRAEVFGIRKGIIPVGLEARVVMSKEHKIKGSILTPFVTNRITPNILKVIVLEDFGIFRSDVTGDYGEDATEAWGTYLNPICVNGHSYSRAVEELENTYGVTADRAIIFPEGGIFFQVLLHEMFHDVFWCMPQRTRQALARSAKRYCDETALVRYANASGKSGQELADEFIAAWYTRENDEYGRFDERVMPKQFKMAMTRVGYKVNNPPSVFRSEDERCLFDLIDFPSDEAESREDEVR
jgi:hypothetical protein